MTLKEQLLEVSRQIEDAQERLKTIQSTGGSNRSYELVNEELKKLYQKLKQLDNKHLEEYRNRGFKPEIGDGRYYKFPDKDILDVLRVEQAKLTGKDLSISYCGISPIFNNDYHVYVDVYQINGKIPYRIMYDSSNEDSSPSILVRMAIPLVLDDKSKGILSLLTKHIEFYSGKPVNLIYTDRHLKKVSFARIGENGFYKNIDNIDAGKEYYKFFDDLYDDYDENHIKNTVYIGSELTEGISQSDIGRVQNKILLPGRKIVAKDNSITCEELDSFNEKVKRRIIR